MAASRRVKELAADAGFPLAGIAPARVLMPARERYLAWVADGRQGQMGWIDEARARRSSDPGAVLDGARSVICVAAPYFEGWATATCVDQGLVARYAWGDDYHALLGERVGRLADALRAEIGGEHRWYVDTGPLMDKALAAEAGIGFYGKNTNILTEELGSWVFLGEIVTTLALAPDLPLRKDCGSCRACQVACPTGALGPDYSIDARRCISYLTIEHRGPIDRELRPLMGSWVYGCDICQEVCPPTSSPYLLDDDERRSWASSVRAIVNGEADRHAVESGRVAGRQSASLSWLLRLTHDEYLAAFRGSAIRRAKVWMLRRNAAVALGNVGTVEAVPALLEAMETDDHPVVRGHAAWAIGRMVERGVIGFPTERMESALDDEEDGDVRGEIEAVLGIGAFGGVAPRG